MPSRNVLAVILAAATATAVTAIPGRAEASMAWGRGWFQHWVDTGRSVSGRFTGYDFGVGYTLYNGVEGYNFDQIPDQLTLECTSFWGPDGQRLFERDVGQCNYRTLPGTSSPITQRRFWQNDPVLGMLMGLTRSVTYDVPDTGKLFKDSGTFNVPLTLLSQNYDLLQLSWSAEKSTSTAVKTTGAVRVLGYKVDQLGTPRAGSIASVCPPFFTATAGYSFLGVGISVKAAVTGCLYVDAETYWTSDMLVGGLTPGASIQATLSAGVGFDAFILSGEAGVRGNLTLLDARIPVAFSSTVASSRIDLKHKADLTLTGLDGGVELYARACFLFFCDEETMDLFRWTGLRYGAASLWDASWWLTF